jgi:phosphatidylglycerophosphatase C
MTEEKTVVVFDFDRTLTSTDTIKFLIVSLLVIRPLRIFKVVSFVFRYGIRGLFLSADKHALIGRLLKKRDIASVNKSLRIFKLIVQRFVRNDIKKLLSAHLAQNAMVIIGTASPDFAVRFIYKNQQPIVVGTAYEAKEGKYTGELLSPVCIGREKLNRIRNMFKDKGPTGIDVAYSDHSSDLPLLRYAKKAVFVYPDKETRGHIDHASDEIVE